MERSNLIVVDSHHKVLSAWAKYRHTQKRPPRLLTLDHHTDTSKPFRNYLNSKYESNDAQIETQRRLLLNAIDFRKTDSVANAIEKLSNDEHIVTALKSDIISSALVLAHNAYDTDLAIYKEHRIICRSVDRKPNSKKILRSDCDNALESFFLNEMLVSFNDLLVAASESPLHEGPYILDIDLDYFNTLKSISPDDSDTIRNLAKNAGLITVATEPDHVRNCALDFELKSETLLSQLQKLMG